MSQNNVNYNLLSLTFTTCARPVTGSRFKRISRLRDIFLDIAMVARDRGRDIYIYIRGAKLSNAEERAPLRVPPLLLYFTRYYPRFVFLVGANKGLIVSWILEPRWPCLAMTLGSWSQLLSNRYFRLRRAAFQRFHGWSKFVRRKHVF